MTNEMTTREFNNNELMFTANSALQSHDLETLYILQDTVRDDEMFDEINVMSIESMIDTLEGILDIDAGL